MLIDRITSGDLDLAIVTHIETRSSGDVIRLEPLLWVTSAQHCVHEDDVVPLALGRPTCNWRLGAVEALERAGRSYRILYASWNSTAVGAAVMAGLAVSVLPESAVRPGMRVLGAADGFPALPPVRIALVRNKHDPSVLSDGLAGHIIQSLDNLSSFRDAAE
jgi:DNA-binding transcriptional LysR family regulator